MLVDKRWLHVLRVSFYVVMTRKTRHYVRLNANYNVKKVQLTHLDTEHCDKKKVKEVMKFIRIQKKMFTRLRKRLSRNHRYSRELHYPFHHLMHKISEIIDVLGREHDVLKHRKGNDRFLHDFAHQLHEERKLSGEIYSADNVSGSLVYKALLHSLIHMRHFAHHKGEDDNSKVLDTTKYISHLLVMLTFTTMMTWQTKHHHKNWTHSAASLLKHANLHYFVLDYRRIMHFQHKFLKRKFCRF